MFRGLVATTRFTLRRPDLVRNRIFGWLNIWPVSPLTNPRFRDLPWFCINLEKDRHRRALAARQARRMGIADFRIVKGIVGADLDLSALGAEGLYDDVAARCWHGRSLSPAEIGLSLSHARIYEMIVAQDLDAAIILEDDALLLPKNLNAFDFSAVPEDFDILFLHAQLDRKPPRGKMGDRIYSDASYTASTAAYMVSRKGAILLAEHALPVVHAADGLVGRALPWDGDQPHEFRQQGVDFSLNCYIMYPFGALNGSTAHFTGSSLSHLAH